MRTGKRVIHKSNKALSRQMKNRKDALVTCPMPANICLDCSEEKPKISTVALLQQLQDKKGWLPEEDMKALSKELGIPGITIFGVATFYSQFRLRQPGQHVISMCRGTACHVRNSGPLLTFIEEMLGIKVGHTTPDCKISLESVNCIGACAKAPAMMIDGVVYGELDKDKIAKIIARIQ